MQGIFCIEGFEVGVKVIVILSFFSRLNMYVKMVVCIVNFIKEVILQIILIKKILFNIDIQSLQVIERIFIILKYYINECYNVNGFVIYVKNGNMINKIILKY